MLTAPVILTAIISSIGLLLNILMLYLVLSRGRLLYHYLFAAILLCCAIWDFGILLSMLRNQQEYELVIFGYIVFLPCTFLSALVYQFTCTYLKRTTKTVRILWIFSTLGFVAIATGLGGKIDGVFHYSWGNMYRPDGKLQIASLISMPVYWFTTLSSSWMLFQASKKEASHVNRRHMIYMAISFVALTLANIKVAVLYDIDCAFILPAGMFVNDIFSALIAIAIIKHHLFDITLIIKKTTLYSALAGIVIFVFSFSEHILITYMGEMIGGHSQLIHYVSIGLSILVLMPVKNRIEAVVERVFAEKQIEF
jgi:hypothetical protein